jgi:hypothetical protein
MNILYISLKFPSLQQAYTVFALPKTMETTVLKRASIFVKALFKGTGSRDKNC